MFKRNSLRKYFTLILMFFTVVIGFSSWIIVGEKNVTLGESPVTKAVCYYTDSNGNKKEYTRIEKALEDANSEATSSSPKIVYVVPGLNKEIKVYKDCTIGPNVTLCLPHSGTSHYDDVFLDDDDEGKRIYERRFLDSTIEDINKNRVTYVTFNENVEMTILSGGKLFVGGQFGRTGQTIIGQVTGAYCEIGMRKNSKIISSGSIDCYGYIKEIDTLNNNSILELKKGIIKLPFVIYDFKGGSITTEVTGKNICPFDMFDLPNIQTKMRIYSGVIVESELRLSVNAIVTTLNVSEPVKFIGNTTNNTMIALTKGYIDWKYTPSTMGLTLNDTNSITNINLHGEMSFGSIQISAGIGSIGLNIDTNKYFLPLSYKLQINVEENSNLYIDKKIKLMPGCKIVAKQKSNITINSQIILYPEGYTEGTSEYATYPTGLDRAKLYCNGIITITNSGILAGKIDNSDDNAILGINSTSFEVTSTEYSAGDVTAKTQAYIDDKLNYDDITNQSTYVSKDGYWIKFDRQFTLSYYQVLTNKTGQFVLDEPIQIDGPTDPPSLSISGFETLDIYDDCEYNSETYRFTGWYYDEECKEKIDNNTIYGTQLISKADLNYNVKLYARWSLADPITVTYTHSGVEEKYLPGDTIKLPDNAIYDEVSSDGKTRTIGEFAGWNIYNSKGETLAENVTGTFTIDENYEDLIINISPNYSSYSTMYRIFVSGSIDSITGASIDNNNYYWAFENDEITVTITGKAGYRTTTCTIVVDNGDTVNWNDSGKTSFSVRGSLLSSKTDSDKFYMPASSVTLST